MSIVLTRYFVVVCDWCGTYVTGTPIRRAEPGVMLVDPVAAIDAAVATGWITGIRTATGEFLAVCPVCVAGAEREARDAREQVVS